MTPPRRQGGFKVLSAGGTLQPRRLGILARILRAWNVLTTEPKASPFSKPRIEGDCVVYDPCPAFPCGKVMPRPGAGCGQDPTPRTGSGQADAMAEAMRRALGG